MTGSGDTTIAQWDVVRGESVAEYKSHTGSVKTIDIKQDEPSTYMYMYIRNKCVMNMYIHCVHVCKLKPLEIVLVFSTKCTLLSSFCAGTFVSGGRDGSIYVWDTRCSSRGETSISRYILHAHTNIHVSYSTVKVSPLPGF